MCSNAPCKSSEHVCSNGHVCCSHSTPWLCGGTGLGDLPLGLVKIYSVYGLMNSTCIQAVLVLIYIYIYIYIWVPS